MEASLILINLTLGGFLGLLGQGVRVIAGLKKLQDASQEPLKENTEFDLRRLCITFLIGFIAGGLGIVGQMEADGSVKMDKERMLTLIGIGYAGVDFIEAFLMKYISKEPIATKQPFTKFDPEKLKSETRESDIS